jgi:hypothetical protein
MPCDYGRRSRRQWGHLPRPQGLIEPRPPLQRPLEMLKSLEWNCLFFVAEGTYVWHPGHSVPLVYTSVYFESPREEQNVQQFHRCMIETHSLKNNFREISVSGTLENFWLGNPTPGVMNRWPLFVPCKFFLLSAGRPCHLLLSHKMWQRQWIVLPW